MNYAAEFGWLVLLIILGGWEAQNGMMFLRIGWCWFIDAGL